MNIHQILGDSVKSAIGFGAVALSPVVWVFETVILGALQVLLKLTPAGALLRRHAHLDDCIEHLARESMAMPEAANDLLVHGKRREYAETILPPSRHPTWYTNVPKHLRKSIISHGRIRETGLSPSRFLAGGALTADFVAGAWRAAYNAGLHAGWAVFLAGSLVAASAAIAPMFAHRGAPAHEVAASQSAQGLSASQVAREYVDVWSQGDVESINQQIAASADVGKMGQAWAMAVSSSVSGVLRAALLIVAALVLGVAVGRLVFIGKLRALVYREADESVSNLRKPFREALQRWRFFWNDRKINDKGYNDQVHFATQIDRSPLIYFGEAEGMTEFAGHLLGPREGHEVKQSVVDMLQHTMVLGGSGESKSRDFYVPLLAQLLELRKQGYPIATYITDEKGAIVDDVKKVVGKLGMEQDLLIIGTGEGEWRVDLMDVGRPFLVAEFIKSAAMQAGAGKTGDDFWLEMGNDLGLNLWTLTEAAQYTEAAREWERANGMRFHSIKNMLRLAISDEELEKAIAMVTCAMKSPAEYVRVADFDEGPLMSSIEYLVDQWMPMADVTRDGIKANLRKALRTFTFKPEIATGFADGAGEKLLSASEMHSNRIKVLNVSQIEHGSAGRLVNIMLKSAFFKQCRDVQQQNPAFVDERLAWWFNPALSHPKKDDYYLEFFLADEYQALITADSTSGYSDLTVWNVLRSAGVAGVTISQGIGAYESAIGKDAAANVLRQWRSKHFLRTEDVATIDEAKKLLGKTMRFHVAEWGHYESTAAVRAELGTDPDNLRPIEWNPDRVNSVGKLMFGPMDFSAWDNAYDFDDRFVLEPGALSAAPGSGINAATIVASKQQAAWRQEDRQINIMQHGLTDTDVLRDEQIMEMTRGRALSLVQVAGGTVVDIIRLNAAAYRRYTDDETIAV